MFAKRTCHPVIGDDAAKILNAFYVELRQTNLRSNGSNPITMRQLESLARLTQVKISWFLTHSVLFHKNVKIKIILIKGEG
jgi:DNA replicative helicase MCM subunit Mcm2 (Cdc46/Mcm family)